MNCNFFFFFFGLGSKIMSVTQGCFAVSYFTADRAEKGGG